MDVSEQINNFEKQALEYKKEVYANLTPAQRLQIARHADRPTFLDYLKLIENSKKNYDVVYVDPPYASDIYEQILPKLNSTYVVAEHSHPLEFNNYTLFKQKNYGGKMVSILVSQKQ